MKYIFFLIALFSLVEVSKGQKNNIPENQLTKKRVRLPNGWSLSPAGRSLPLGDLPLNMAVSSSNKYLAVTNNGQSVQSIQLIDPKKEKVLHTVIIPKSWYGLKFSADEKFLYASGGNDNWILQYAIVNNKMQLKDSIILGNKWPEKISPAGIDIDDAAKKMYVVTKENNSLYVINLTNKSIIQQLELGNEAYACLLSPDKKELYISSWGGDKVLIYDTRQRKLNGEVAAGDHPTELLLNKKGNILFVANANDNSVSVIDIKRRKALEVLNAALYPDAPAGSTSNGLALSADEKKLYVANADNNFLTVFDESVPGSSKSKGFIPVGWYPTNIKVIGKKIFVSNGKGFSSFANPDGPDPVKTQKMAERPVGDTFAAVRLGYIGGLMKGTMSIIDEPADAALAVYSKAVYNNTPYTKERNMTSPGVKGNPVPMKVGEASPIKHVFYIIKENRTYDQMMGDVKEGNGDPDLCLFPEKITPNHHALAREFVLLDNFYVDAEVSPDGHNWSTAAYSTDFVEKTWPTLYGQRGGTYDFEGTREIAYPRDGFIWDYCKRAGISYRSYGEFADNGKANTKTLEGHICPAYEGFNLDYKDVDRFAVWQHDFDSLLSKNSLPSLSIIRLPNDHTSGQRKGKYSPFAAVGDNDLALGMLVEYISQSYIWKQSAIFVLEDDAQNGPDHVDAHRSPSYVISPYIKRGTVNHTMYSTSGILRTMELILGLPPMSQYDAAAIPLYNCFTSKPDFNLYKAKPANVDLEERNTVSNKSAKRSQSFNLAKEDAAPDLDLNEVVWKFVKGENSQMPAPRRSAFIMEQKKKTDD